MLTMWTQAVLARLTAWSIGSVARVTALTADADMCLLLRVELPRCRQASPTKLFQSVVVL
jgi:hypothetical protein